MQVPLISSLYQRVLGHPFVYEHVRPFVVGGVDNGPAWRELDCGPDDVIVDVGCGTGDAFAHAIQFRAYHGFDTDVMALAMARRRSADRQNVHFEERVLQAADLEKLKPTRVMLCGLLHHISDSDALDLLGLLARSPGLQRVTSLDPTFLPGRYLNNFFTRLDRGRFPRTSQGYAALAEKAGFRVAKNTLMRSHPTKGRMDFVLMVLEPASS